MFSAGPLKSKRNSDPARFVSVFQKMKSTGAAQIGWNAFLFRHRSDAFHLAQNGHFLWLKTTSFSIRAQNH